MGGFWLEEWSQGEPEKQCYGCGEIYPISQLLATSLWYQGEEHPVYYCYKCGKLPDMVWKFTGHVCSTTRIPVEITR